ncbi:MAG: DEAD/DEAH box helicase [Verrucomicrobia bacterium]|nr:DEAD/DEAH box helicase [Verrucomicrobiota bacterium]MCH8510865.1 DEAD/DEAH box helicase [Kiritimatiellia bacterium]
MIAPIRNTSRMDPFEPDAPEADGPAFPDCTEGVHQVLGEGGMMSEVFAGEGKAYEQRPQQLEMAEAIAACVHEGKHLVVEAGTGVGKSFAYLVPTLLAALETKQKVVVSTYTISLQEQLLHHDVPRLSQCLGREIKAVLVKGRSNYLCRKRLALARRMGGDLFHAQHRMWLDRLDAMVDGEWDGSLQSLKEPPPPDVWAQVCAEEGTCVYPAQREHKHCPLTKARAEMQEADILIVNHAMFFADLAMRGGGGGLLPEFDVAVLDEAHQIEDVAGQALGLRITQWSFIRWIRSLYNPDNEKGLLAVIKAGQVAHEVGEIRSHVDQLFQEMQMWLFQQGGTGNTSRVRQPLDVQTPIPGLLNRVSEKIRDLEEDLDSGDLRAELALARRRAADLANGLLTFLEQRDEDCVYWIEREGQAAKPRIVLNAAPIQVGPLLKDLLFDRMHCVVLASATLAVGGNLGYCRKRLGAENARELQAGSPFDHANQMRVIVPTGIPEPNQVEFADRAAMEINRHVRRSEGGAFVLFTSIALMKDVLKRIESSLTRDGYSCWVQGRDQSRHQILEAFKRTDRSVLFGLNSFWMGVDVPGEALRNVIITKLPFAVPDHPLIQARMEQISSAGGNAFKDYSLPEAVLKFKQGVGRLIRSREDRGTVVILDPRIRDKWYGRWFVSAIPECPWESGEEDL